LFKGTRRRNASQIASSLESLGGTLNAFTSREQTCFHALVLDEHLEQAVDVLTDIVSDSTISPVNIKREKLVVCEEIREVNETPADRIHELFSEVFWQGQSIGRPIMGSETSVMALSRKMITRYMADHYRTGRVVVAASGNVSHAKLVELVKNKFTFEPGNGGRGEPAVQPASGTIRTFQNGGSQTHFCLGFPGFGYSDLRKFPLLILHYYLGGGMSSILFQKIREQKGMAYTVYTFPDFYRDGGVFGVYMAADRVNLPQAADIILKEFRRLKKNRMPKAKLDRIKDQCKGHLILGMESTNGRMNRMARQEIMASSYTTFHDTARLIEKVKPGEVLEVARQVLSTERMIITTLGSARDKDIKSIDWSILD
jgi:predicted Zn-dependent peptidase